MHMAIDADVGLDLGLLHLLLAPLSTPAPDSLIDPPARARASSAVPGAAHLALTCMAAAALEVG